MNPSWHKIRLPFLDERSLALGLQITQLVQQQDQLQGNPKGVAVFSCSEFSDDQQTAYLVYYLSPVAARLVLPLVKHLSFEPCEAPDPESFNFALAYGTLEGSESWDLLK